MLWHVKLESVAVMVVVCVYGAAEGQQQDVGVILPTLFGHENNQSPGISFSSTSAQRPSAPGSGAAVPQHGSAHFHDNTGGVPLEAVTHQQDGAVTFPLDDGGGVTLPVEVVPLEQGGGLAHPVDLLHLQHGGGIPLPGAPQFPVPVEAPTFGLPLPSLAVGGGGGVHDAGVLGGIPGGMLGVRNLQHDQDVQRMVHMPSLLHHLQAATRARTAVKITDIITAHKQMVSGQLVYLTLRLGETRCPRGTPDVSLCEINPREDSHICEVVVWERPWLNSTKIIHEKSRCADTENDTEFKNYLRPIILPAASPSEVALPSLPRELDEQQVAAEAFSYVDHGSDSDFRGYLVNYDISNIRFDPLINTTRAQVNVEYGFTYCLKSPNQAADPRSCPFDTTRPHYLCSVIVMHSPNHVAALEVVPILDDRNNIHCEMRRTVPVVHQRQHHEELVVPLEASCSGCPHPVPLNDPSIMAVAEFALTEYDRTTVEEELHTILRLIRAHSQVISGVKYFLTVELADTDCKKRVTGVDVNRTFCLPDPHAQTKICDFQVIDQPWVPIKDLVMSRCQDSHIYQASNQDEFIVPVVQGFGASPSLLGGTQPVEMDEATMNVVQAVVVEFNRREDDFEFHKLVKVHEASSQVVAGSKYHLVVELGETMCNKHDPATGNGDHCPFKPAEEHEICEVEVHVQPWLQTPDARRFSFFKCYDFGAYLKKMMMPEISAFNTIRHPFLDDGADVAAGYQHVALNDTSLEAVAHFVIDQYNLQGTDDELYTLTRVVSASSHSVPEGTMYHLELEIAETHCKKYLPVLDPSRCPIDRTEEHEICQAEALIPLAPDTPIHLIKLFCDEISDYYTRKLRGKLAQKATVGQHGPGLGAGAPGGVWTDINVNDPSLKKLGHWMADEYDARSDEDNLFIFHKVIKASKQVAGGILYHLIVELQETVCPKYKRRIHKSRCVPDIGEEHMVCEANILSQPWLKRHDVSSLRCAEKDDYYEGDDSVEVLYPNVHPTAHARPRFQSQFIVRSSDESEESNERFYDPSRRTSSRSRESKEDDDSDEHFYHASGRRNSHYDDSDEDDDSDEIRRRLKPRPRGKRAALGGSKAVQLPDARVAELAEFALVSNDNGDPRVRIIEKVLSARKKIVAGEEWTLEMSLMWTKCKKTDAVKDVAMCERDLSEPASHCTVTIYLKPWVESREVSALKCIPVT